jgi:hypothetical protein
VTTYLFDYFKNEKLSILFPFSPVYFTDENGQKIVSLAIGKKLSFKIYCTNSSFNWYLSIKFHSNNVIRKVKCPFLEQFSSK